MREKIALALASLLYWLGDLVSKLDRIRIPCYSLYHQLMIWSMRVQEWGGAGGPWREPTKEEQDETDRLQ